MPFCAFLWFSGDISRDIVVVVCLATGAARGARHKDIGVSKSGPLSPDPGGCEETTEAEEFKEQT